MKKNIKNLAVATLGVLIGITMTNIYNNANNIELTDEQQLEILYYSNVERGEFIEEDIYIVGEDTYEWTINEASLIGDYVILREGGQTFTEIEQ